MYKNKRGVNAIIVVVLLILIAFAAVAIFVGVFLPMIRETSGGTGIDCFTMDLKINKIELLDRPVGENDLYLINFQRGVGKGTLSDVIVVVHGDKQENYEVRGYSDDLTPLANLGELESFFLLAPVPTTTEVPNPVSIGIAPVLNVSGKNKICHETDNKKIGDLSGLAEFPNYITSMVCNKIIGINIEDDENKYFPERNELRFIVGINAESFLLNDVMVNISSATTSITKEASSVTEIGETVSFLENFIEGDKRLMVKLIDTDIIDPIKVETWFNTTWVYEDNSFEIECLGRKGFGVPNNDGCFTEFVTPEGGSEIEYLVADIDGDGIVAAFDLANLSKTNEKTGCVENANPYKMPTHRCGRTDINIDGFVNEIDKAHMVLDTDCRVDDCSDGTILGRCSSTKPKYCKNGILIDKCGSCPCDVGTCNTETGSCE